LEKRVGDISRDADASAWQISWQMWPSLPEDENTLGSCAGSVPAFEAASKATAKANFTTRPVRRRSAGGNIEGMGNMVGAAT
jgi:hypothetical protein